MADNLRVWAPKAHELILHLDASGEQTPMVPVGPEPEAGWWSSPTPLESGTRYSLTVNGEGPFPDPRTRRQPEGIHGPSEIVDTSSFLWTDDEWHGVDARGAITYELHIGTFTPEGTFQAAVERLAHLKDLGVDIVEVMPIVPVPGTRNWGYDGVSLYAVTENYGGPEGFAAFVDAAHTLGLGVCLDVVYNHLGPDGNYLNVFGPYFTDKHETPWGWAVNLDGESNAPVRRYIIENAMQWIRDYHVDALRLDAVAFLIDESERHLLADLSDEVAAYASATGRRVSLIAESDLNDPLMVTPTEAGGRGMTGQWDDDIHHALHAYATEETFAYYGDFVQPGALEKVYRHAFAHDGNYSSFRGANWGSPVPPGTDGHRFVACTEDHDQVGNRAIGDRPSAKLSFGQLAAQMGLLLGSPFSPMLFMGQEWATRTPFQFFTDHAGDLGKAVEEGRINEFKDWDWLSIYGDDASITVPNPQDAQTFTDSILPWGEEESGQHKAFLDFVTQAIALRKASPDIAAGDLQNTEIVRLGRTGYLRRGAVFIAYSFEPDSRVALPATELEPA
ncbi:malto-oligosyltrehalose trehalohydrolase, partial [Ancrocorticia sp.]|uniref:malto-oligosyltrehalose trehalohydrolase n=1 Tax=Ancrocorticia sp. TaxID=2593684 RepID=UPI003F8D9C0E